MPRSTPLLLLFALLFLACGTPPETSSTDPNGPVEDPIWDGELQVTGADARFMTCASGIRYPLVGPGLDTVLKLYANQRSVRGQTMKAWLTGHLAEQHAGQHDTAFVVSRIDHIDATLSCPPRPNARIAGRYTMHFDDPMGTRTIRTDLFANGEVLSYTFLPGRTSALEQDGLWGVTSSGEVEIHWPHLDKRVRYSVTENALTINDPAAPKGRPLLSMQRTGPPLRMDGTYGRVVRWLVAVSAGTGQPLDSTAVGMYAPLEELLSTDTLRNSLRDSAITWVPLTAEQQRVEWPAMSTVHDLVALKRMSDRRAR
jgi:hypothetical protein